MNSKHCIRLKLLHSPLPDQIQLRFGARIDECKEEGRGRKQDEYDTIKDYEVQLCARNADSKQGELDVALSPFANRCVWFNIGIIVLIFVVIFPGFGFGDGSSIGNRKEVCCLV